MLRKTVRIDDKIQVLKSTENKYLTFVFSKIHKQNVYDFNAVGWTEVETPPKLPDRIIGVIHLWGYEIAIKDVSKALGGRSTKFKNTSCLIIFEETKPKKGYWAMLVDGIPNVITIAERDIHSTAVTETIITDQQSAQKREYDIIDLSESAMQTTASGNLQVSMN